MAEIENVSYQFNEGQVQNAAKKVAGWLQEEIDRGHRLTAFTILLTFALIIDAWELIMNFVGAGEIFDILPIGWVVHATISFILWYFMSMQGWWAQSKAQGFVNKYELKIIFWGLSFLDGVPVIDTLPFQTFAVLKVWKRVKKRADEAQEELAEFERSTANELEKMREVEEAERVEIETEEAEEEIAEEVDAAPVPQEEGSEKTTIIEGGEESEELPSRAPQETMEEIFIPEESRDPLGKLKKEFFDPEDDRFREAA
jgi:hypothetical protein